MKWFVTYGFGQVGAINFCIQHRTLQQNECNKHRLVLYCMRQVNSVAFKESFTVLTGWDSKALISNMSPKIVRQQLAILACCFGLQWFSNDRITGYSDVLKADSAIACITSCRKQQIYNLFHLVAIFDTQTKHFIDYKKASQYKWYTCVLLYQFYQINLQYKQC